MAQASPLSFRSSLSRNDLIYKYFDAGFTYEETILLLEKCHGIKISLRTIHRVLRLKDLRRRCKVIDTREVLGTVSVELQKSNASMGYRAMFQQITKLGVVASHDVVRIALKHLDPKGVSERQAKRLTRRKYYVKDPDEAWHLDGNDKLKPFGFSIHGCIDGYSRKMLWLEVCPSNKDSSVIGEFFVNYVLQNGGTAKKIRADRVLRMLK